MKKSNNNETAILIISLCFGIVCGLIFRLFPEKISTAVLNYFVDPAMSTIFGLFSGLMVPYVFLEIVNALCGQSGKENIGNLVGKMMGRFVVIVFSITTFSAFISLFFFRPSGNLTEEFNAVIIVNQLRSIFPTSFFSPFVEGNIIQVVVISVLLGISLLILGKKVSAITQLITQGSVLVEKLFSILATTVPVVAFLSLFKLAVSMSFAEIKNVWKVIPAIFLSDLFFVLIFTACVCGRRKLSIRKIVRIFKDPLLKAFASGTSSIVIQDVIDISEENGLDSKLVRLHAPLSFVFLSTGYSLLYVCSVFCMAELTGVSISWQKLFLMILLVFQFTVATPRVSGGCLTVYTVLLAQLGIPTDGAAVVLVLSIVSSNFTTGLAVLIKILDEIDLAYNLNAVTKNAFSRK